MADSRTFQVGLIWPHDQKYPVEKYLVIKSALRITQRRGLSEWQPKPCGKTKEYLAICIEDPQQVKEVKKRLKQLRDDWL